MPEWYGDDVSLVQIITTEENIVEVVVPGATGDPGVGVPAGGTTGQALVKNSNTDFDTEWATPASSGRELLTANRTYYVRTDGSNSNTGLANTAVGAWLTLQYAYDYIASNLDLGGFTVTLQIADGTYAGGLSSANDAKPIVNGPLYIRGNVTSPQNVVINDALGFTSSAGYSYICVSGVSCTQIIAKYSNRVVVGLDPTFIESGGIELTTTNVGFDVGFGARLELYGKLRLTAAAINAVISLYQATLVYVYFSEINATNGTITLNWSFLYAYTSDVLQFYTSGSVIGTFTGLRVEAYYISRVIGDTGNQTFVPGNANGTIDASSVLI